MQSVKSKDIINWINNTSKVYNEKQEYLTDLDREIGDGDHGVNMNRGFKAVVDKLKGMDDKDIGTILKTVAMTLISTVGGASGPLYGSLFLKSSMKLNGKNELIKQDIIELFKIGLDSIVERGKAQVGDKTLVDSLTPAVEYLLNTSEIDLKKIMEQASKEARKGAEGTIPLLAKKGRASYLGERSINHKDPGSESMAILLEQFYLSI